MKLFNRTIELMQQVLDLRAAQHQVIAANIANEETPGFRANELGFTDALTAARRSQAVTVQVTHPHHIAILASSVQNYISPAPVGDLPLDANSVNIDLEMAKLSNNAMSYNMTAELLARRFRGLRNVIREGK